MKKPLIGIIASLACLSSTVAMPSPTVNGNTIQWPDDGWYQVQTTDGAITLCNGGESCTVDDGTYLVINHTSGVRYTNIIVGELESPSGITVSGQVISWPDDGWYQVQSTDGATTYCNGGSSCPVEPGNYLVINHTSGRRYTPIVVSGAPAQSMITVSGTVISWPDEGWYQVQSANGSTTYCNGGTSCEVAPGTYLVINHTTGERFNNIVVEGGDSGGDPGDGSLDITGIDFGGELSFSSLQRVDLDPLIDAAGLWRATNFVVSGDGSSVRANILDDSSRLRGVILIDTATGTAGWLATDIADGTGLLFDVDNQPIAAYGEGCSTVSYTPEFNDSVLNLNAVLPTGRCVQPRADIDVSANGNTIVFYSIAQGSVDDDRALHSYRLDTASLTTAPEFTLTIDDGGYTNLSLPPRANFAFGAEYTLSEDGNHYFSKRWWEGTNPDGGTHRQVGAVLWDTDSQHWQTRGQAADRRGCIPTQKVTCDPPYHYAMSSDGQTQYFSVPTDDILVTLSYPVFKSQLFVTEAGSTLPSLIPGTGTVRSLRTNNNGDLLLLRAGEDGDRIDQGYALFQKSTNTLFSLNRALQGCALKDEAGNPVDAADCEYSKIPFSITNNPDTFTTDGKHLLIRSISRFTADFEQSVDHFLIDLTNSTAYTLPDEFFGSLSGTSADTSVMIGTTGFPDYDVLIGKR